MSSWSIKDGNKSYTCGQLTDNDGSEEARYLRHRVRDPEQDTGVRPRHLGVGEVEPAGDGQLVQAHTQGDQHHVAYLHMRRWSGLSGNYKILNFFWKSEQDQSIELKASMVLLNFVSSGPLF